MGLDRRLFSERDYRLFRATAVLACAVAFASIIILIFWILSLVLSYFYTLLLPLAVAGVLALVLIPVVLFFQKRLGVSRLIAVILVFLIFFLTLFCVYMLVLPTALGQAGELVESAPELLRQVYESLAQRFPQITEAVSDQLEETDWSVLAPNMEGLADRLARYGGVMVGLGFVPLFVFFMLMAGRNFQANAREVISMFSSERQEEIVYLTRMFIDYVTAFFQGQLIIAIIMGVLLAIGFTIIGLQAGIVLGILLGLLNIVPFLGTVVGLALALPIAWLQPEGGIYLVGLVLVVFAVVQLMESWVLTPRIMSEKSGLHPAVVVVSLFFWGIVFGGVIGMILAVPLSAFLVSLWWHVKQNYLRNVVSEPDELGGNGTSGNSVLATPRDPG